MKLRTRLAVLTVGLGVAMALATPAQATMPHVQAPATMPHVQAPATIPHAAAATRWTCGPLAWGTDARGRTWGGGQACYRMIGGSSSWQMRVADIRTDGGCAEGYRYSAAADGWVRLSPRVVSCTTGAWKTLELGTASKPTSGARVYRTSDWRSFCVPLPPGYGGCW